MDKFISSDELWDYVCKNIGYPDSPRGKTNITIAQDCGTMDISHYSTGFGIRYSSIKGVFNCDVAIENANSSDCNFLCFNIGDGIYMEDAVKHKTVKWDSGVCLHGEQHTGHISNSIYRKNQDIHLHCIGFDKDLFKEANQNGDDIRQAPLLYKGDYIDVHSGGSVNMRQQALLSDLTQTSALNGGKLQELYLESKLLELVCTSLNHASSPEPSDSIRLSQKDIECLHAAKEILLASMQEPPSIKELSKKAAINEFKLKKGFKQLFGTTVYGALHDYRLENAKTYLAKGDISVQEAAKIVGYKSVSHFSKVFKEKYNATPLELSKKDSFYYISG